MLKISKIGLTSVAAGAVLAIGGSTAVASPTPLVAASSTIAAHVVSPSNYPVGTAHCTVYPATITAGGYVTLVCTGFYPHTPVLIKGAHVHKIRHASRHGKIVVSLHLKHAGVFTLCAIGKSPHGIRKYHRYVKYTATVTVLPS